MVDWGRGFAKGISHEYERRSLEEIQNEIISNALGRQIGNDRPNRISNRRNLGEDLVVAVGLVSGAILLILVIQLVPQWFKLTEGIVPYESASSSYHFTLANPTYSQQPIRVIIEMSTSVSTVDSHNDIRTFIKLIPDKIWQLQHPNATGNLAAYYYIIFEGSDCRMHKANALSDGSCFVPVNLHTDGIWNGSGTVRYTVAGDFQVLLALDTNFIEPISDSGIQHIVIEQVQVEIANTYAYFAVVLSSYTLIALIVFELYRSAKSRRNGGE